MALPVLDKTWQFNVNQPMPASGTSLGNGRQIMWAIKNSLIGFASSPWTVRGSSSSTAAGMDSVDRWVADTNLVWANSGTAHSWIVLRQPGVHPSGTFELCIDLNNSSSIPTGGSFTISPSAGFTGGSTTARPTATDEIVLPSSGTGWGVFTSNVNYVLHVWQTTDGQVTYVVLYYANTPTLFWVFARAKNPVTGWAHPFVAVTEAETGSTTASINFDCMDTSFFNTGESIIRSRGTTVTAMVMTSEATTQALLIDESLFSGPNDFNGEYPLFSIGVISTTASNRGRHGQLFDLWLGLGVLPDGATYPNDTTRQFVQMGIFVLPWNGSVPVTS